MVSVQFFQRLLSSSPFMSSFSVPCKMYGKEGTNSEIGKLRSIVPLPAVLQIADALLATQLRAIVDAKCVPPDGYLPPLFGARRFTQPLDITHAIQLLMEQGLDSQSQAGVDQMDVEKFYDSIRLVLIVDWLLASGGSINLVGALLRHQLLQSFDVKIGNTSFELAGRSKGSLTGSSVAGICGRIPVESRS